MKNGVFYGRIQKKNTGGLDNYQFQEIATAFSQEMYNITDAVLAATLKDLIADGIVDRKSYDEIPPRVEYSLTGKGNSVVPILQSICRWSDIFYKEDVENEMKQCQKCDYHR